MMCCVFCQIILFTVAVHRVSIWYSSMDSYAKFKNSRNKAKNTKEKKIPAFLSGLPGNLEANALDWL